MHNNGPGVFVFLLRLIGCYSSENAKNDALFVLFCSNTLELCIRIRTVHENTCTRKGRVISVLTSKLVLDFTTQVRSLRSTNLRDLYLTFYLFRFSSYDYVRMNGNYF